MMSWYTMVATAAARAAPRMVNTMMAVLSCSGTHWMRHKPCTT